MHAPVPPAPPGYVEPEWRHDTIDALVVIDRTAGFPTLDEGRPTHPIDRFVAELQKRLQVLMNVATYVATTDEIRYEEDIPTQIYAVVTNEPRYAAWCKSWGGNLVEVSVDGESLVVTANGSTRTFPGDEITGAAVEFSASAVESAHDPDAPLDRGLALLEPVTRRELAGLEPILAELWSAIDHDKLTDAQRVQIVAMAELIRAEQVDATPGETPRWRLVGPLRTVLTYLYKELPKDALAWWKLAELLSKINWSDLSATLTP